MEGGQSKMPMSGQNIAEAFKVIVNPLNNSETISAANNYLQSCEQSAQFVPCLLQLYRTSNQTRIQLQCILLILNIIKRQWQTKRGRGRVTELSGQQLTFSELKPVLRRQIVQLYPLHGFCHVKHFNQIFKFLSRQDYPAKYPQLQEFIVSSLKNLGDLLQGQSSAIQNQHNVIISLLSTVKIVLKEFASRRLSHSQDLFNTYIAPIVEISTSLSGKLHELIQWVDQQPQNSQSDQFMEMLLESSKKIDKILLYCIQCMPSKFQHLPQVQRIFHTLVKAMNLCNQKVCSSTPKHSRQITAYLQGYLGGVLQQAIKVQTILPFLLVEYLSEYIELIVNMLVVHLPERKYSNERLIVSIVQANLKIFTCFTYYMNFEDFSSSIYNRNKDTDVAELQQKCHKQFTVLFNAESVTQFLSKLLTEVMVCSSVGPSQQQESVVDQELVLEEHECVQQDALVESTAYSSCVLLCKNIVRCFKRDVQAVLENLFGSVAEGGKQQNNSSLTSKQKRIVQNSIELILVLPKIYDQDQLPLHQVTSLLQTLFANRQYAMLARLVKNYHEFLDSKTLQSSFQVLSDIVATPLTSGSMSVDIIYQCALTMKKIMLQNDAQMFATQNFSGCMLNLLNLLTNAKIKATPTLMWPLINLSNQLLKLTPPSIVIEQVGEQILDCLASLTHSKYNEELVVGGLCETIENLLGVVCSCFKNDFLAEGSVNVQINQGTLKQLYEAYTLLSLNIDNRQLENVDLLFKLWLCIIRHYPTMSQQEKFNLSGITQVQTMNTQMREFFNAYWDRVFEEDSILAIQILEEHLIVGLVQMNETQIKGVFERTLKDCLPQHKMRSFSALFSMYYCYLLISDQLMPEIVQLLTETLVQYHSHISPQINGLRNLLMIILNYSVLRYGANNMYPLINGFFGGDYTKWFYVYVWSGQYVSNKLCHKINGTAYLKAIEQLGASSFGKMLSTPIQEQFPLDIAMKTMILNLEPMKVSQTYLTFTHMYRQILPSEGYFSNLNSTTSRKIKLQLSGLVKTVIQADQRQNYKVYVSQILQAWNWGKDDIIERFDKTTAGQIISLIKGNYSQEYDVNQQNPN